MHTPFQGLDLVFLVVLVDGPVEERSRLERVAAARLSDVRTSLSPKREACGHHVISMLLLERIRQINLLSRST